MLTELGQRIYERSDNFNKELEGIKKKRSELKTTKTEIKKHPRRNEQPTR